MPRPVCVVYFKVEVLDLRTRSASQLLHGFLISSSLFNSLRRIKLSNTNSLLVVPRAFHLSFHHHLDEKRILFLRVRPVKIRHHRLTLCTSSTRSKHPSRTAPGYSSVSALPINVVTRVLVELTILRRLQTKTSCTPPPLDAPRYGPH